MAELWGRGHWRWATRLSVLLGLLCVAALSGAAPGSSGDIGAPIDAIFQFQYPGSVQTYTVPANVNYLRIQADGAAGGGAIQASGDFGSDGYGASMQGDFDVTPGETLSVLVGEEGIGDSGGGGTFVWSGAGAASTSNLLLAAGGGGGGCYEDTGLNSFAGHNASIDEDGNPGGTGGDGGPGGAAGTSFLSEYTSTLGGGGGGAGILTGGADGAPGTSQYGSQWYQAGLGGQAISLGGAGGAAVPPSAEAGGYGGGGSSAQWGGSGPSDAIGAGGGGGGYSGGAGGDGSGFCGGGGGGGSYDAGATPVRTLSTFLGGEVLISWLQKITFTTTPNPVYGATYHVAATGGGSGEPVVFTIDPASGAGVCSLSGSTVSLTNIGECIIDANQEGQSDTFAPADEAQQEFYVSEAPQSITFGPDPADPEVGTTWTPTATGGGSGNPVTFSVDSSSDPGVCSLSGGVVSFNGVGTCRVLAQQAGNDDYLATSTIHAIFTNPAPPVVDDTETTLSPSSQFVSPSLNEGIPLTITVTDTSAPSLAPAAPDGSVRLGDSGGGGQFGDDVGDGFNQCSTSNLGDDGYGYLVPISATASQCQVLYYPAWEGVGSVPASGFIAITADYQGDGNHTASTSAVAYIYVQVAPPTISASATSNGVPYTSGSWTNHDVVVHFDCSADAGVASVSPDQTVSTQGAGQSVTGTCTDTTGSSASATFSGIGIDKTPPLVSYHGNANSYTVDQQVAITCSASDALSGLASNGCQNISGAAYTFALGTNSFSATATDNAGNSGHASTSFTVAVTPKSLGNLGLQFVQSSARFKALSAKQQTVVDLLADAATDAAAAILPKLKPAQTAALLRVYDAAVTLLARGGWLTNSQADRLTQLAAAL